MKLCKLSLYMLYSLFIVTIFGGILKITEFLQGILCLIIIFSAVYDGIFVGTVVGAFTGLAAGSFSQVPLLYALIYGCVGIAFGVAGDIAVRKSYVNVILCACVMCLLTKNSVVVDITTYAKNVFFSLILTVVASPILYLPLKAIHGTGRIKWKNKENS